jgi:hypothetical protein
MWSGGLWTGGHDKGFLILNLSVKCPACGKHRSEGS